MEKQFQTPILMIVFNRPDTTQKVFNQIKKIKPKSLYISADGPREGNENDKISCKQTRDIIKQINWDCNLHTNFLDKNLGCRIGPPTGISWFFSHEEQGIILEDDCLPNLSFFQFCEELLNKYKENKNIFMISGNNFLPLGLKTETSYYFSHLSHIWGWASWRRAWKYYDIDMKVFPDFLEKNQIEKITTDKKIVKYYNSILQDNFENKMNGWDWQWLFILLRNNAFSIAPSVNLISNIGFDGSGTHTLDTKDKDANLPTQDMEFPLVHTNKVEVYQAADNYEFTILPPINYFKRTSKRYLKKIGMFNFSKKVYLFIKNKSH